MSGRKEYGIVFPDQGGGDRSTTAAGKKAFGAALSAVDPADGAKAEGERNWRYGYTKHVVRQVQLSAQSKDKAVKVARAGLEYLHNNFQFVGLDGKSIPLDSVQAPGKGFHTCTIKGKKPRAANIEIEVPYKDKVLKGHALSQQLDRWAKYGTIEKSCADAIKQVVQNPQWLDLSDLHFVLLGAGSAMGPLLMLLSLGANIIAVDLDRAPIWERLLNLASMSTGSITFPVREDPGVSQDIKHLSSIAGCNLFTQPAEISNWVSGLFPQSRLVIGGYAYLDGEAHVRVAMAMDAIMQRVCAARPSTSIAFLNTPTQVFVVPSDVRPAQIANAKRMTLYSLLIAPMKFLGRYLIPNAMRPVTTDTGASVDLCDGLVVAQGPNYALAKCIQHWRAVLAKESGHLVSSNVAPSTATASVVHNRSFAWAYGGMHHFKPMEIFQQETSNAVMGALLIRDLRDTRSAAHPSRALNNPWELFADAAFHGGVWRMGYKMDSIGPAAAILYFADRAKPFVLLLTLLTVAAFFYKFFL
mmetsp:Transcript_15414/g.36423  ORF Transcript_15414/g.36423 Transcript_15414/m.36423 type:complete len:527 (-) Transcript_15414:136-1716(-)